MRGLSPSARSGTVGTFAWLIEWLLPFLDSDGDAIPDALDNGALVHNADQRDRHGNVCDADPNNDGLINGLDFGLFREVFFTIDADLDGDGLVNAGDLAYCGT